MSNQKIILSSLAMDLNRVALGLHRGSNKMAQRFLEEALVRKSELDTKNMPLYIRNILDKIKISNLDEKFAEETMMYSILLENFSQKTLL